MRLGRLVRRVKQVASDPKVLLAAYLGLGAVDSVLAATDAGAVRWATKPLLMPLLAAFVTASARRDAAPGTRPDLRLPLIALAGGCVGDVGLLTENDALFLAGMAGFAAGHVAYLRAFTRVGGARELAAKPWIPAGYAAAWAATIAVLWNGLDDLRVPVLGYSLLLTAMAATATGADRATALGGALFLASDTVIALDLADLDLVPGQDAAVMPLYIAAQLLLMRSWARWPYGPADADRTREAAADPGSAAAQSAPT